MAQHFLLTAKARTLSLASVFRLSDDEAHATFVAIRFADNGGEAFCPRCQCTAVYTYAARRIWKCKACSHQFSVTSGTIFASRKLAIRDYLAAIVLFVNAVKGISALQLGRDLDVQYKTSAIPSFFCHANQMVTALQRRPLSIHSQRCLKPSHSFRREKRGFQDRISLVK